ncbi:hypothetical protein EVC45_44205 [Paraburkholderia sp. UYCP14C]|uniref:hypothetical protein n=1 Tax=Paraburkholderia sp. UYCP14C TaxID=2511130 RepID=UPI00101EA2EB|nr:hypothetical protein [Paraburkholderia sp. UYCP14C]RZF23493.1 hypothetical protein EVC45_44205 [Paraburkholderia sp. UYCP14C]
MQLERKDNLGQQAGGIRRTFYAPGKDAKNASDPEDREFIERFKKESIARELKEKNVNDFAESLARLSNELTRKTGLGIAHRGIDDPALDKAAKHLDGLFSRTTQRALTTARANERFRLRSSEPDGEIESDAYGEDEDLIALFIDRAPMLYADATIVDVRKALRHFSTWLRSENLPSINQLLSRDKQLKEIRKTYLSAYPRKAEKNVFAINTVKKMGLTVTPERNVAGSQPFSNVSSHSWPSLDEGGPPSINPYGYEGFGNTPGSDFFKGLPWEQPQTPGDSVNQPYGYEGFGNTPGSDFFKGLPWEQTPSDSVNQPHDEYGVSESYPTGYYVPWSPPVQSQAHDPYSSTWNEPSALNPPRPEIGHLVGSDWQHGNQRASDALISVLSNQGLAPYEYMPETELDIHGERYRAVLQSGQRQPNAFNPLGLDIRLYYVPRGG